MFKVGETVYLANDMDDFGAGTEVIVKKNKKNGIILEIDNKEIIADYNDILRRCPFCGGVPKIVTNDDSVQIRCCWCEATSKKCYAHIYYAAIDKTIEHWNSRV